VDNYFAPLRCHKAIRIALAGRLLRGYFSIGFDSGLDLGKIVPQFGYIFGFPRMIIQPKYDTQQGWGWDEYDALDLRFDRPRA
jgi:hypothetical protein